MGHVGFAKEALLVNGFKETEFHIHHGVAHAHPGIALFPIQDEPGKSWGLKPLFNVSVKEQQKLKREYYQLRQIALDENILINTNKIDFLHIDIQGGEVPLVEDTISFLNDHVAVCRNS
jgi:hypothetical protein